MRLEILWPHNTRLRKGSFTFFIVFPHVSSISGAKKYHICEILININSENKGNVRKNNFSLLICYAFDPASLRLKLILGIKYIKYQPAVFQDSNFGIDLEKKNKMEFTLGSIKNPESKEQRLRIKAMIVLGFALCLFTYKH